MFTVSTHRAAALGVAVALLFGAPLAAQGGLDSAGVRRTSPTGNSPTANQPTANQPTANQSTARQSAAKQSRDSTDHHFVHEASIGGLTEVRLGKMAQNKAKNQKVKDLGEKMVTDHSKANDELAAAAKKDGIHTAETKLDSKQKGEIERLGGMSGKDFDKAYLRSMLKDHQEAVEKFQQEASSGQSEHVKEFAKKTLPKLENHLAMVEKLAGTMGVDTTATSSTSSK